MTHGGDEQQPPAVRTTGPPRWTRRRVLAFGAAAPVALLTACRGAGGMPSDRPGQTMPDGMRGTEGAGVPGGTARPDAGGVGASGPGVPAGDASAGRGSAPATDLPATAAVEAPADPGFGSDPFRLGVASGDPLPDGVVLWTRLAPDPFAVDAGLGHLAGTDVALAWDVALDEGFAHVVASGTAVAAAADGHSVHVDASGLTADGVWWYRFRLGGFTSRTGRTRTAPRPGSDATLVVVAASCQHFEHGTYVAHRHLAAEAADVVLWLGDFIYEGAAGAGTVRTHPVEEAADLAGYRLRYAWYRADEDLQAAQAATAWVVTWDDHEVANNHAADRPAGGEPSPVFDARRAAAQQAWWENQPVRLPRPGGRPFAVHRDLAWGSVAHLVVLDGRSHRSPAACGGTVGNACPTIEDDSRTMLGPDQEGWTAAAFSRSAAAGATWTVVGNQTAMTDLTVPLGSTPITLFDQWDGYPAARRRLIDAAGRSGLANLLVLTGDLHCSLAGDLVQDGTVRGSEIVAASISSPFPADRGDLFELGLSLLPQVKLIDTRRRGYARVELDGDEARIAFRHVADATDPASAVSTTSQWSIRSGRPGVRRA